MSEKKPPGRPTAPASRPQPSKMPQPVRESTRDGGYRSGQDSAETSRKGGGAINFSPSTKPPPKPKQ